MHFTHGKFLRDGSCKNKTKTINGTLIESHFPNDTILRVTVRILMLFARSLGLFCPVFPEALMALRAGSKRIKLHVCEGDLMPL